MAKDLIPKNISLDQFLSLYGEKKTLGDFLRSSFKDQIICQKMHVIVIENKFGKSAIIINDDVEDRTIRKNLTANMTGFYTVPVDKLEVYL